MLINMSDEEQKYLTSINVSVRLEPELLAAIDKECLADVKNGRLTRSEFIRLAMCKALRVDPRMNYHHAVAKMAIKPYRQRLEDPVVYSQAIQHADNPEEVRILSMVRAGNTMAEICQVFNEEGVPAKRGGTWKTTTIKSLLERLLADSPVKKPKPKVKTTPKKSKPKRRCDAGRKRRRYKPLYPKTKITRKEIENKNE